MAEHAPSPPETGSEAGVHLRGGEVSARPGLTPPDWAVQGALYCVFPRAFSPRGDLASILPELDRIAGLGARGIWLLPVHPIGAVDRKGKHGSPYAIRDDRAVHPDLGREADLRALADACHERGLALLIDLVANHCAKDHVALDEHPGWVRRDGAGSPTGRVGDWSDVADRRFEAPGVAEYLVESAAGWVERCGVDGFRCDVAGMAPQAFWRALHERLAAAKPDHFLLAEWQDAALHTIAFHASYDWLLYRALRDCALGTASALAIAHALAAWQANFPAEAIPLRFLENHDEPRAVTIFGRERLPAYAAVAFLSGGLPMLYNGQEVGATHRPSLFEREPVDWRRPAAPYEALYRSLIGLARKPVWGPGRVTLLPTDAPADAIAFTRGEGRGILVANLGRGELVVALTEGAAAQGAPATGGRAAGPARRVLGEGPASWDPSTPLTLPAGAFWAGER
jgi:glycosidase